VHNLGSDAVIIDLYNEDDEKITPKTKNIIINSDNKVTVEFDTPMSGYALILTIGNLSPVSITQEGGVIESYTNENDVLLYHGQITD